MKHQTDKAMLWPILGELLLAFLQGIALALSISLIWHALDRMK